MGYEERKSRTVVREENRQGTTVTRGADTSRRVWQSVATTAEKVQRLQLLCSWKYQEQANSHQWSITVQKHWYC